MDALNTVDRRIEGEGTSAQAWLDCVLLASVPEIQFDELVPRGCRLVVVAPHPDDEILGCAGLMRLLVARPPHSSTPSAERAADAIALIAVTDGEASHPGSMNWSPPRLAARRRQERAEGLRRLGWSGRAESLKLPDGAVQAREADLTDALVRRIGPRDVLVTTWRLDGHPDHEATGRACARACAATGAHLLEVPVWAWHWAAPGDDRIPWRRMRRLALDDATLRRKREAIAAHRSQWQSDGDRPPVLFPEAIERCMRRFESFLLPEDRR